MTKEHEAVSVILPAHNAELTLLDTLKSVLTQTYPVAEIIAAVDASTDNTLGLLNSAADDPGSLCPGRTMPGGVPKLKIIETQFGSPSLARNAAIDVAGGDVICFLDADDIWADNKTLLQIRCLADGKHDIVCSQWTASPAGLTAADADDTCSTDVITGDDLLILNRFQTSTVMMRRSCVEKTGYFESAFDGAEDWEFWIRAAKISDIARINKDLVYYRDNVNGYSKNLKRHYGASKRIVEKELLSKSRETGGSPIIRARRPGTDTVAEFRPEEVMAWHYLRFVVAFFLIKDYKNSFSALGDLVKNKKPVASLRAVRKLLYPFLKHRFTKRVKPV